MKMQCEGKTARGARCKLTTKLVRHRHTDGHEYLCCKRHHNSEFRPYTIKPWVKLVKEPQSPRTIKVKLVKEPQSPRTIKFITKPQSPRTVKVITKPQP